MKEVDINYLVLFSYLLLNNCNASGQNRVSISGNLIPNPQFVEVIKDDDDYTNNFWYFLGRNEKLLR